VNIRNAVKKDITGIVSLGTRFVKEVPTWGQLAITEDYINKLDLRLIWVVEENDDLLGYAICLPRENDGSCIYTKKDKILELDEIYLIPEARGKGIGAQILQEIESNAKKEGYTKLFVYSSIKALDSVIEFYRANGFQTWAVQLFKEVVYN